MLAIRLQRTGRKGHSQFRLIVQDARLSPKSGKVVMQLGSYDPHTKAVIVNAEKAKFYLDHGAQPSVRVAGLLKNEVVKLPKWVPKPVAKKGKTKNPDKFSGSQPTAPVEKTEVADQPTEESKSTDEQTDKAPAEADAEIVEAPATKTVDEPDAQAGVAVEDSPAEAETEETKDETKA